MQNPDRDKISRSTGPTDAGDVNRATSEHSGSSHQNSTSAEFGQNIGRSENLNEPNKRTGQMEPPQGSSSSSDDDRTGSNSGRH